MAVADFLRFNCPLLGNLSLWVVYAPLLSATPARPPRVRTITFIPSTRRIYCMGFGQCRTSFCHANSSAPRQPSMRFLFIGPGLCLRLPSDSTSRWTPLPSTNGSHCQAHSGLSPPSYHPCRAHKQKPRDGEVAIPGRSFNSDYPPAITGTRANSSPSDKGWSFLTC